MKRLDDELNDVSDVILATLGRIIVEFLTGVEVGKLGVEAVPGAASGDQQPAKIIKKY